MITSVKGEQLDWTPDIWAKWDHIDDKGDDIKSANYYTPRPWRNEYDTGSREEGFIWDNGHEVYYRIISTAHLIVKEF